jgi:hypothetical protein
MDLALPAAPGAGLAGAALLWSRRMAVLRPRGCEEAGGLAPPSSGIKWDQAGPGGIKSGGKPRRNGGRAAAINELVPNRRCASFSADYGKRGEIGGRFGTTRGAPWTPLKPAPRIGFRAI